MLRKLLNLKWAGALALACTLSLNAQVNLSNNLIDYYQFDGNANDLASSNNGTVTNGTYVSNRFGESSKSLFLSGTNSGVDFTSDIAFSSGSSSATFSLWFNTTYTGSNRLLTNGFNGNEAGFFIGLSASGQLSFGMGDKFLTEDANLSTSAFFQTSLAGFNNGVWHNVIVLVNSSTKYISMYVDGIKRDMINLGGGSLNGKDLDYSTLTNVSLNGNTHIPFVAGKLKDNMFSYTVEYYKGIMDEIRIYGRVLNSCEIDQINFPFTAQPVMATTPGTTLCKNTIHTFAVTSVAGQTYKWEVGGGGTPTPQTGNSASIKWSTPGSYVITITAFNSCSVPGVALLYPVTITSFSGAVLTVAGPSTTCVGSTCFYTTNAGNTSYEWSLVSGATTVLSDFNGKTAAITFLTAGVNYVKVRAQNSCGWGDYTTYPVTVNGVITNFSISGLSTVCPNGNTDYTITGITPSSSADAFLWVADVGISHIDLNSVCTNDRIYFPDNQGGTYNISVVGLNACGLGALKVKTVTIASGGVKPSLTCVGTNCAQLKVNTPGAGISICWYVNGGSCTFSGQTLINRTPDVQIRVSFTNTTTGCSYDAYYFPSPCPGGARIEESSMTFAQDANPEAFKLYPNPNEGNFIFETDGAKGEATLINIMGQIIDKVELYENQYTYSLNVSAKSTYVLRIRTATANKNIKFVVK